MNVLYPGGEDLKNLNKLCQTTQNNFHDGDLCQEMWSEVVRMTEEARTCPSVLFVEAFGRAEDSESMRPSVRSR